MILIKSALTLMVDSNTRAMYLVQLSFVKKVSAILLSLVFFLFTAPAHSGVANKSFYKIFYPDSTSSIHSNIQTPYSGDCKGLSRLSTLGHGAFGNTCLAKEFGNAKIASLIYNDFIFNINKIKEERKSGKSPKQMTYLKNITYLLRSVAAYVFDTHNPILNKSKQKEKIRFTQTIVAMAAQETLFSHFRSNENSDLMIVVGDKSKRHNNEYKALGITQINELWHQPPLGVRFDIVMNMAYGINYFYEMWKKAKKQTCVKKSSSPHAQSRAAYSAYNGGLGRLCRFVTSDRKYKRNGNKCPKKPVDCRNDRNFLKKINQVYAKHSYLKKINDTEHNFQFSFKKVLEGRALELLNPEDKKLYLENTISILPDGKYCRENNNSEFICTEYKLLLCLPGVLNIGIENIGFLPSKKGTYKPETILDKNELCERIPSLRAIGSYIKINKGGINFRNSVRKKIGVVLKNQIYQVLDYKFSIAPESKPTRVKRWYKVRAIVKNSRNKWVYNVGYIFAGSDHTQSEGKNALKKWVKFNDPKDPNIPKERRIIPMNGERFKVIAKNLPIYNQPNGRAIKDVTAKKGDEFTSEETHILDDQTVWIRIKSYGLKKDIYIFLGAAGSQGRPLTKSIKVID